MNYLLTARGDGGIVFGIILAAAVVLAINYFIAREFMRIAEDKGYYDQKYLWITFFLGIIGMLLVIALPNKKQNTNASDNEEPSKLPTL